jgi:hypothetical protein
VPFPVKGSFGFVDQDSLDQADFASDTNDIPCGVPLGGGKKRSNGNYGSDYTDTNHNQNKHRISFSVVLTTPTQTIIKINIEFLFE